MCPQGSLRRRRAAIRRSADQPHDRGQTIEGRMARSSRASSVRWISLTSPAGDRICIDIRAQEGTVIVNRLAGAAVVLVALGAPGASLAGTYYPTAQAAPAATTVHVTAKDFAFVLSRMTVPHGQVKFVLRNVAPAPHNFAIAGHTSKTIGKGSSTTLTVMLKRGRYPYKCTVDSHAELGMKGVLRVT
jgi:plastocyanin